MSKPTIRTTEWGNRKATVVTAPAKKPQWGYFAAAVAVVIAIGVLLILNMDAST